ncbi:MAG: glyoxylate/hydroxypyruvate reductase A [Cyclobacteriaceae bacterium]|nr:glyoxylate/hydroxypyruvate reductase A [Cyclobacteriaceae bacterium]
MAIVLISSKKDNGAWVEAIKQQAPDLPIEVYPHVSDREKITGALLWAHPAGVLDEFPHLQWVSSLGAGANHILTDPHLPENVLITRVVDENLATDMGRTALMAVLTYENNLRDYFNDQIEKKWRPQFKKQNLTIGILGLGEMGRAIALDLQKLNFRIWGYSLTKKSLKGVKTFHGPEPPKEFLQGIDVLVSVLPLTSGTRGILNKNLFGALKRGTYLINLGRGEHLHEADLVPAIEKGQLSGAYLDVFCAEPLPEDHPFWIHRKITITPHVASLTNPASASTVIVDNYRRLMAGQPLKYVVDKGRGY